MKPLILNAKEIEQLATTKRVSVIRPITAKYDQMRRTPDGEWLPWSGPKELGDLEVWHSCNFGRSGQEFWIREAFAVTRVIGQKFVVYAAADNRTDYGGPWKSPVMMSRRDHRFTARVNYSVAIRLSELDEDAATSAGYQATKEQSALELLKQDLSAKKFGDASDPWCWFVRLQRP